MTDMDVDKGVVERHVKDYFSHGDPKELAYYLLVEAKSKQNEHQAWHLLNMPS